MPDQEVYLPDSRVTPVKEKLLAQYPELFEAGSEFLTVRHEPPFSGQLPTGEVGHTNHAVVQFLVVSPHPRPLQRRMGIKHVSVGTVFEQAWEEADSEYRNGHYVNGDKRDPLEVIYAGLCFKHSEDLKSLKELMN